eukprot:CAMPEP_0184493468 /NCGR_PEP_ID=MMETSP0113_2-20130426/26086_1 /TAXON_ID=91329 /ORGANISM="Norrisiella sphaerica, Strain BC52" /LENGTH=356 /DNA_ID=CAMNT_0026878731 /DNA_START=324 /DNA_END=1394 /DNA_ORIENTATION=+
MLRDNEPQLAVIEQASKEIFEGNFVQQTKSDGSEPQQDKETKAGAESTSHTASDANIPVPRKDITAETLRRHPALKDLARQYLIYKEGLHTKEKKEVEYFEKLDSTKSTVKTTSLDGILEYVPSPLELDSKQLFLSILQDPSKKNTAPWTMRCRALVAIREVCTDAGLMDPAEFQKFFAQILQSILLQLSDRRSQVCKLGCAEIGRIVVERKGEFLPFAPPMLRQLFGMVKITKKVISESASLLAQRIVQDVDDDISGSILDAVEQAAKDKARHVRLVALRVLRIMITLHVDKEHDVDVWDQVRLQRYLGVIKCGTNDSDSKNRSEAVRAFVNLTRAYGVSQKKLNKGFVIILTLN